jgi:RNA polymerase sigma-B factor
MTASPQARDLTTSPGLEARTEPPPTVVLESDRSEITARLLREVASTTDPVERKRLQDEVVVLNMGVARAIAVRYRDRGIARDDLMQAAYVGLVKAVQGFDPSFERDFLSYAVPTVTGEVKRYFRDFWLDRATSLAVSRSCRPRSRAHPVSSRRLCTALPGPARSRSSSRSTSTR